MRNLTANSLASRSLTCMLSCFLICVAPAVVFAQGGGNANAVGTAVENSIKSSSEASTDGATPAPTSPGSSPSSSSSSTSPSSSSSTSPSSSSPMSNYPNSSSSSSPDSSYGSPSSSDSYYGSSSTYGSPQNASTAVQRGQIAMSAAIMNVSQTLASFFAPAASEKPLVSSKLTLWEEAAIAFYGGDQRRALALFHAHVVADGEAAEKARAAVTYSRLLKRPVWAIRFGLSIHARIPDSMASDPQPIREGMQLTGVNVRNIAAAGAAAGGNQAPGENLAVRNDPIMSSDGNTSSDGRTSSDSGIPGATRPASVVTTFGGEGAEEARIEIESNLGIVADIVKSMFDSRMSSGKFGNAYEGMREAGETLSLTHTDNAYTSGEIPMWTPGIDYLGMGPASEMIEAAKKNEIDVLLHFQVSAKENKVSSPQYIARGQLILVSTGETLGVSKAIDKFEVAGRRLSVRDAVSELLVNLFEIMDKRCAVEPLPALQPAHAVARIDALLGGKTNGSMGSLAEMAMFHSRGLLDAKQLDQAIYYAAGEDGLRLLHDEDVSRYEAAKDVINRELAGKVAEE